MSIGKSGRVVIEIDPRLGSLQTDLDARIIYYNNERTHQGKMCCGRTPMDTLIDSKKIWQEKLLN